MTIKITPIKEEAESEGVWADYMGVPLRIARWGTKEFTKAFRKYSRPHTAAIKKENLTEDQSQEIMVFTMAETILLGWDESKFIIEGQSVPYNRENARELLRQDRDCFLFVMEFAKDMQNYLLDEIEEMEGK